MNWTGWLRMGRDSPWQKVCTGNTLSECARKLTREADKRGVRDTNTIITGGGVPFTPTARVACPKRRTTS